MEEVILVDTNDQVMGSMDKLLAHQKGMLHRAFSVFMFNTAGKMLIHQRAAEKYHSAGLWSNACCSHPKPQEATEDAVKRRMWEELGLEVEAQFLFKFEYEERLEGGLTEHELDHVYLAVSGAVPQPNPDEIQAIRYLNPNDIEGELNSHPEQFTVWFRMIFERVMTHYRNDYF